MGVDVVVEVLHDFLALPTEVQYLADAGVDGAVAHDEDHVAFGEGKLGVEHLLAADGEGLAVGEVLSVAVVVPDGFGVVEFEQVAFAGVVDMDYGEGAVGKLAFLTYRECLDDGLYTLFDVGFVGHHGAKDFAGESGKDIGFHATA